jgi:putative flippase GtrA
MLKRITERADFAHLARFAVVGVATAGVYLGLLWLVTAAGLSTVLASAPAFLIAVGFNYLMHKSWTFANDEAHARTGPRFAAMIIGGLIINSLILYLGTDVWDLGFWLPQLTSIGAMVIYNYVILSQLVFSGRNREH